MDNAYALLYEKLATERHDDGAASSSSVFAAAAEVDRTIHSRPVSTWCASAGIALNPGGVQCQLVNDNERKRFK